MLSCNSLLLGLAALTGFARAVGESKGAELMYMYKAYRLDIEASLASRLPGSADPAPWSLGTKCESWEEDFPTIKDFTDSKDKKGCNIHGFIRAFSVNSYTSLQRKDGFSKVKDPWNPTLEELFEVGTWGRVSPKEDKFIYSQMNLKDVMGKAVPADWVYTVFNKETEVDEIRQGDRYDFENTLGTVGYLAKHHLARQPDIAKPYLQDMEQALKLAKHGRQKEEAWRMIDAFRKDVAEIKGTAPKKVVLKDTEAKNIAPFLGKWKEINFDDLKDVGAGASAEGRKELKKLSKRYVRIYRNDGQEASHARIKTRISQVRRELLAALKANGVECTGDCPTC